MTELGQAVYLWTTGARIEKKLRMNRMSELGEVAKLFSHLLRSSSARTGPEETLAHFTPFHVQCTCSSGEVCITDCVAASVSPSS